MTNELKFSKTLTLFQTKPKIKFFLMHAMMIKEAVLGKKILKQQTVHINNKLFETNLSTFLKTLLTSFKGVKKIIKLNNHTNMVQMDTQLLPYSMQECFSSNSAAVD